MSCTNCPDPQRYRSNCPLPRAFRQACLHRAQQHGLRMAAMHTAIRKARQRKERTHALVSS
jgi:hypothetical protein